MDTQAPLDKWKTSPNVDEIMAFIQRKIDERRRGGVLYDDEIRAETAIWLSELLVDQAHGESSIQHYLDTVGDWRLLLHPNFSTHRGRIGRLALWFKKRILYPPLRWIVEHGEANAWRQDRLNLMLLNLIEEMALETGRLKARLARLEKERAPSETPPPPPDQKGKPA
jgi:hypothetical protein